MDEMNWGLIAGGLAVGMFGWLLYRAGLTVIGGVLGAATGGALGLVASRMLAQTMQDGAPPWLEPLAIGLGLVLGLAAGVMLMRALQIYAFFAAGAILGAALAWEALSGPFRGFQEQHAEWVWIALVVGAALAGGFLLVALRQFIVAVITSIVGAMLLAQGAPPEYAAPTLFVSLAVFLAIQAGLVRRFVDKEHFDKVYVGRNTGVVHPADRE